MHWPDQLLASLGMLQPELAEVLIPVGIAIDVQRFRPEPVRDEGCSKPPHRLLGRFLGRVIHCSPFHAPNAFAASMNRTPYRRMWKATTSPPFAPQAMQRNAPTSTLTR